MGYLPSAQAIHKSATREVGEMRSVTTARSRREEYAEATYGALVESAAACFSESGFAATSLDCVAHRACVTKGAIYHHFASKRDLFLAVLARQQERMAGVADEAGANATDVWGGMVAAFDAFLELISVLRTGGNSVSTTRLR